MLSTDDKALKCSSSEDAGAAPAPARARTARTFYPPCPCRECGREYTPRHLQQEFCSTECKAAWTNRAISRGLAAYDLLMSWRGLRRWNLISAVSALVRDWRAEDRDAGRAYRPRIYNPFTGRRETPRKK